MLRLHYGNGLKKQFMLPWGQEPLTRVAYKSVFRSRLSITSVKLYIFRTFWLDTSCAWGQGPRTTMCLFILQSNIQYSNNLYIHNVRVHIPSQKRSTVHGDKCLWQLNVALWKANAFGYIVGTFCWGYYKMQYFCLHCAILADSHTQHLISK